MNQKVKQNQLTPQQQVLHYNISFQQGTLIRTVVQSQLKTHQEVSLKKERNPEKISRKLNQKKSKKYPPTKIKIVSPFDYTHLESHRINVALANYNNFIQLCFK